MKPLSLILALLLCLTLCPAARAEDTPAPEVFTSGDYRYILLEDGTAEITRYYGNATKLTVPNALDGIPATRIGNGAFSGCNSLTEITLPDSVVSMGSNPFRYCEKLTALTVSPDHSFFAVIDGVLFEKATRTLICYPMGKSQSIYAIPQGIQVIGDDAFYSCKSLTSITIPDSVTTIGNSAFSGCDSLTEITIPDSVTAIGEGAFYSCDRLTSITIPDSVTTIGEKAFFRCGNLTATVGRDSYALQYCKENGIRCIYPDSLDWLNP